MLVQVHTNGHAEEREGLVEQIEAEIREAVGNFSDQLTRVEVHLADENSHKGGDNDKRCTVEARIENMPPVAVTHHAGNVDDAVNGASEKIKRALSSTIGRLRDARQPDAVDPATNLLPAEDEETTA